jgi:type IV pilus assembly protein PilC
MGIDLKEIERKTSERRNIPKNRSNFNLDFLNKEITLFSSNLSDKKKERFFSDLSILLTSGIDIKTAMEIIIEEQEKAVDKNLYIGISNEILKGKSLSEAILDTQKFSNYDYFNIKIGEESGRINVILTELNSYYSKKIKQKRQLINAFTYPILVLITALAAVVFMMNFMVPMFVDIFSRSNKELPYLTKLIVKISDFFSAYFGYFLLLSFIVVVTGYFIRKNKMYRKISSQILLKLPLFGNIIKLIYLERFFQSLALLIKSKVVLLKSIQLVKNMIEFYPFVESLEIIEDDILHGELLNESMMKFSLFDKRIISLIKVGEEVNRLDEIFEKLNKQYSEELEHKISLLSSLLEPILIIFIGILVAVILIAMYLPMFQMGSSIY